MILAERTLSSRLRFSQAGFPRIVVSRAITVMCHTTIFPTHSFLFVATPGTVSAIGKSGETFIPSVLEIVVQTVLCGDQQRETKKTEQK